jgi:hypothetical protein
MPAHELISERYPLEVIQAAQVLGVRMTKDHFFPKWKVQKLYNEGLVSAEKTSRGTWRVQVKLSHLNDKGKTLEVKIQ